MAMAFVVNCRQVAASVFTPRGRSLMIFSVVALLGSKDTLPAQHCELYPIALAAQSLMDVADGTVLTDLRGGTQPGNFGWLTWAGSPGTPALVASLTPPGDSGTYVNPGNPNDHQVSVGDWVPGKPGVANSRNVRDTLDGLKNVDLTVPVWDRTQGEGSYAAYRVSAFARIRLLDYRLPGQGQITVRFLGCVICGTRNQAPVVNAGGDRTADLANPVTLNGSVTDDGLPAGVLAMTWAQDSGPGPVTFDAPDRAVTGAAFSAPGSYVLRLSASDGELSASDAIIVTVNQPNRPPIAHDSTLVTAEDVPAEVTFTGSDPDQDALTFFIVDRPVHGTLSGDAPGLRYTPQADYFGPDRLTFKASDGSLQSAMATITITITPVNDPPAADPQSLVVDEDVALPIILSGSDLEGTELRFSVVTPPAHGVLSGTPPNLVYLPESDYNGSDSFTFTVSDGQVESAPAAVAITVKPPLNHPPVVKAGPDQVLYLAAPPAPLQPALGAFSGSQVKDTQGTNFWLAFPGNVWQYAFPNWYPPRLSLWISADTNATVGVVIPRLSWTTNFTVAAGSGTSVSIPVAAELFPHGIVESGGIQVTASADVSVVGFSNSEFITDSFLALPTDALGTDYALLSYPGNKFDGGGTEFAIVGTEDATTVWITLTASATSYPEATPGSNGGTPITRLAEVPYAITLNTGQTYHLRNADYAPVDFTGTRIAANKPIAVFSGHLCARIPAAFGGCNFLVEQLPPTSSWGRRFVTQPLAGRRNGDTFRFLAHTNLTELRINGALVAVLSANECYETLLAEPAEISASAPILAAQFANAGDYDGQMGDPFMMWLPATDQFLAGYTVMVPTSYWPTNGFPTNYLHLVVPADAIGSIQLDGADVAASAFSPLANSGYDGARLPVSRGPHRVSGAVPFGLWVYGFASFDGYGHPAGAILSEGAAARQLSLTPRSEIVPVGARTAVVATVADAETRPLAGVRVDFRVTGSNPTNGLAFTDAAGEAAFSYLAVNAGADFIFASSDNLRASASRSVTDGVTTLLTGAASDDGLPAPPTLSFEWSQVSGPPTALFSSPHSARTWAQFTQPGDYVLRLTASDAALNSRDDLTVTVQTNRPPVVNAGPDQTILLSDPLVLSGAVTDDGLPPGPPVRLNWSQVVGPGTVSFSNPTSATPTATFNAPGLYVLRLTADDGEASASDELIVSVRAPNDPPNVNAGPPQVVFVPNKARLQTSVTDDGQPAGSVLTYAWTLVSGPAAVVFSQTNTLDPLVTFNTAGIYLLRLTANDSDLSGHADVTVTVSASYNERPLVDAGPDQTIPFAERALLTGKVSDDGGTTGPVRTWWSKISGPGEVAFGRNRADGTQDRLNTATFSAPGAYVLRLTAYDDLIGASDDVTIVVDPGSATPPGTAGNLPPLVNAGPDTTATLSSPLPLNGVVTDDGLPAGYPVAGWWLKVSGPGKAIFADSGRLTTSVNFSASGTYILRLMTTDFAASSSDDLTVTVIAPANQAPTVNAGPDQVVAAGSVSLNGTFTDDGLPTTATPSVSWTGASGPGPVFFASSPALTTSASFNSPGTYALRLSVSDGALIGSDEVTVVVEANQPPIVNAGPDAAIELGDALALSGTVTDDDRPTGGVWDIAWTKVSGPGLVSFTPPAGSLNGNFATASAAFSAAGRYMLRLTAYDGLDRAWDELIVTVRSPDNLAPVVDAGPDQTLTLPATAMLTPTVSDDGRPNGSLMAEWSLADGPGPVDFTPVGNPGPSQTCTAAFTAPGTYVLRLTASDGELTATDEVTFTVHAPAYTRPPPVAELTAPADSAVVTAPTTVRGTASSEALSSYELQYRLKPPEPDTSVPRPLASAVAAWIPFAAGTANVADGVLGAFDPTLLLNGIYELRLVVTDTQGQTATTPALTLIVEGHMKVGHFTLSFTDLRLPVAGIPIEVVRTYDSRDQRVGDFGVGWTLELRNIRLQKNRPLGRGWAETTTGGLLPVYGLDTIQPRIVTIIFPTGRLHKFSFNPTPEAQPLLPIQFPRYAFTPLSGTLGKLEPASIDEPDGEFLVVVGNAPQTGQSAIDLFDLNFFAEFAATASTEELCAYPTLFRFSTPEGYTYLIDEHDGLRSLTDPNGNTLTITTNGILHSAGKSVLFQRDDLGRITNIVDAAGQTMRYQYDAAGNLAAFIDREGHTNAFTYDGRHSLLELTDARGIAPVRNEYDASGRLVKHTDAFGHEIHYTHNPNARQEVITDRLGNVTVHEYDERGNVVRTTDALGGATESTYDANDNLLSVTDPLGRATRYTCDAQNNRTSVTDPLGNVTRFTYNAPRRLTSATDPRGNTVTNTFDAKGNLLSMRDPLGQETSFGYDNRGLPRVITNALGYVTRFAYDPSGNLTNEVDALGHATSYCRDVSGNLVSRTTTRTTPGGIETLVTRFEYDRLNRLTNTILPGLSSTATLYNAIGKPAVTIDQLGRETRFDYDELGQMVRTVYPDGASDRTAYDAEGRPVATTNRLGRVTRYGYDALGRLTRTEFADGTATINYYDPAGQLVAATDARANSAFYGYDLAGRTIAVTNALGDISRSEYDAPGNLTNAVDALGRSTAFLYDKLNRRVQTLFWGGAGASPAGSGVPPEPLTSSTRYDALGHRISETDPANRTTWFGYDALGRLTSVTNALGYVTRYAYDELGQQIAQTDANNHTTRFDYDALGRRTRRTLPGGQVEGYAYNVAGLLTDRVDFNGYATTFFYDAMSRLVEKRPDPRRGEPSVSFAYNALGQRTQMTDAGGLATYAYDDRDRLSVKSVWFRLPTGTLNSQPSTLNYSYDASGNVASIHSSAPNGTAVAYAYDALNRLSEVNDPRLGQTTYTYDAAGNLRGYLYPNGVGTLHQYDAFNRLTNLTAGTALTSVASYAYTVGPGGNRLTATETVTLNSQPRTLNRLYTYDALYRLSSEAITLNAQRSTLNYSYDAVGNRLTRQSTIDSGLPSTSHAYDANDCLATDTYDANGNTTVGRQSSGALISSQYDFENRLTHATTPDDKTIDLLYDGDGNRVAKTVTTATSTVTTFYVVDDLNPTGYAQVLEELTLNPSDPQLSTPAVTRVYGCGHALLSQDQLLGGAWVASFYGCDGHGNVRYLTDLNGTITDTYDYDAFGNLIAQTGTTPNHYLFAGEQWDPDLGLYYLRARYHNPDTGRFWTMDSFEGFNQDPQSLHRYAYCRNNPVNRLDPSGNTSLSEVMTAGGIGAATQGIIGTLLRGVMAYSEGLNFRESAGAAFDPADLSEDVGTGFIAGLTGWGAGKAAAAIAKPVFQALERGAPFLLNWTQRWVVRPLTQAEARLQAAWTSWRTRLLTNPGAAAKSGAQNVFWSGGRAAEGAARTFANANNGIIIGDTTTGGALAQATEGLPWSQARPQWLQLSEDFARTASGEVNVFQNARGLSLDSVWRSEYRILTQNPKVTTINYHVVMPDGSVVKLP